MLLALACAVIALIGLHLARDVFGPPALAAVVIVICLPVSGVLTRRGWPRALGTTAIIMLAYTVLVAAGVLIWFAGAQFVQLVVDLAPDGELAHVTASVNAWGSITSHPGAGGTSADLIDPAALAEIALGVGATLVGAAIAMFFICGYVVVMAVDASRYSEAVSVFGATKGQTIARISHLNSSIRRYYVVNTAFGAVVAIIDGLVLWWLGIPAPFLWAVLAFVTNFIPTVGFVIGLVPPAILALAIGGWPLLLAVVAVYCVVNVVLQVFVQPKFVSDAVGLSLTLSFFTVIFWTFIIGPVGALLAVPLTLLTRTLLLEGSPHTAWLRWVSGDRDARPEPR